MQQQPWYLLAATVEQQQQTLVLVAEVAQVRWSLRQAARSITQAPLR
jgi:hypothetical protein